MDIYNRLQRALVAFIVFSFCLQASHVSASELWQGTSSDSQESLRLANGPDVYRAISLNAAELDAQLEPIRFIVPVARTTSVGDGYTSVVTIEMPGPDGSLSEFQVGPVPTMEPALASLYPELRTYSGFAVDDPTTTIRFLVSPRGVNALAIGADKSWIIEPATQEDAATHLVYSTEDLPPLPQDAIENFLERNVSVSDPESSAAIALATGPPYSSGDTFTTLKMAVTTSGEYAQNVGGSPFNLSNVTAAILARLNQLNAIWERELAVRAVLVADNNNVIFTDPNTDGYVDTSDGAVPDPNDANAPRIDKVDANFNAAQANLDANIAAYDLGHLFLWNYQGGVAGLGIICVNSSKGKGQTGWSSPNLRTFAHELGHAFNMPHTWASRNCAINANGSPSGQYSENNAYEPGSGVTLMAYPNLCGTDKIDPPGFLQYHSVSFDQAMAHLENKAPCGTSVATSNNPPVVSAGSTGLTFPSNTPFVLVGSGNDANTDVLTYAWEEFDLPADDPSEPNLPWTHHPSNPGTGKAPFFRIFAPTTTGERTFPQISDVAMGPPYTLGEELPPDDQSLTFRLHVWDNHFNSTLGRIEGGVAYAATTISFEDDGGAFTVTAPNASGLTWTFGDTESVSWNPAGTMAAPISCATVDIDLSLDGGHTYPINYGTDIANTGGPESITVPNEFTAQGRIRVRCSQHPDHFFFDISDDDIQIWPELPTCNGTDLIVRTLADSGPCSLRDTVAMASPGDTILFTPEIQGMAVSLASQIVLDKNLTIDGQHSKISVRGANTDRVFDVTGAVVVLRNMNLINGDTGSSEDGGILRIDNSSHVTLERSTVAEGSARNGGGIYNDGGSLVVLRSTIRDNNADEDGGAIENRGGNVVIAQSTISGNSAKDDSGGIQNVVPGGLLTIFNTTISGNIGGDFGGGVRNEGGGSITTLRNVTIANNTAASGGGGVHNHQGTVDLANTILADNSGADSDCVNTSFGGGTVTDTAGNIVKDGSCVASAKDPQLAPLANNGGDTLTHALGASSAAMGAGDDTYCTNHPVAGIDQRGYSRPKTGCDSGAYEDGGVAPETTLLIYDFNFDQSDPVEAAKYPLDDVRVRFPPSVQASTVTGSTLGIQENEDSSRVHVAQTFSGLIPNEPPPASGKRNMEYAMAQAVPNNGFGIPPEEFLFYTFDMVALTQPIRVDTIRFRTAHNHLPAPLFVPRAGVLIYSDPGFDDEFGRNSFIVPPGLPARLFPYSEISPTNLIIGGSTTSFRIRFDEAITGINAFTTQMRLDDVEVHGTPIPDVTRVAIKCTPSGGTCDTNLDPNSIVVGAGESVFFTLDSSCNDGAGPCPDSCSISAMADTSTPSGFPGYGPETVLLTEPAPPTSIFTKAGTYPFQLTCSPTQNFDVEVVETPDHDLDHFMFYKTKHSAGSQKLAQFSPLELTNRLGSARYRVRKIFQVGLPADKNGEGVFNDTTDLAEYRIRPISGTPPFRRVRDIPITNQCHNTFLELKRPHSVLIPTATHLSNPTEEPIKALHNLDHFLCYNARVQSSLTDGTPVEKLLRGTQVDVTDGFQTRRYDLKKITKLCVPTAVGGEPTIIGGTNSGENVGIDETLIRNIDDHLVCYNARLATKNVPQAGCGCDVVADPRCRGTTIVPTQPKHARIASIHTNNHFGPLELASKKEQELCIPSSAVLP